MFSGSHCELVFGAYNYIAIIDSQQDTLKSESSSGIKFTKRVLFIERKKFQSLIKFKF